MLFPKKLGKTRITVNNSGTPPFSVLKLPMNPAGKLIGGLKSNLEESDLTIRVDVLDWSKTDEGFRRFIDRDKKRLVF
ncbi:hypothetical protein ACFL5V_05540 [Fibrobacterota bacterium]